MRHNTTRTGKLIGIIRNIISKGLFSLVSILLLSSTVHAQTLNTISVNPSEQTVSGSDPITASIDIDNGSNTGAFEFQLSFDPSVLQLDSATLGDYLGSTSRTVAPTGTTIDNQAGTLTLGYFTLGPNPAGPDGSGTLINLTFSSISPGNSPLTLSNLIITDISGTAQTFASANGTITITQTPENTPTPEPTPEPTPTAEPTLEPTPTPEPTLEPTPTSNPSITPEPTPTPSQSGATLTLSTIDRIIRHQPFNVDLTLNALQPVSGVDVIMEYDPRLLEVDLVNPGSLLPSFIGLNIDNVLGLVRFSLVSDNPDTYFTGIGLLASIQFTPKNIGTTTIRLRYDASATNLTNVLGANTGTNILLPPDDLNLNTIDPAKLVVNLSTPASNSVYGNSLSGTLTIAENANFSASIQTNSLGESQIVDLPDDFIGQELTFLFKADTFLRRRVTLTIQPGDNSLNLGLLYAGDLNDDGIINTIDLSLMYDNWFATGLGDLNRDEIINSFDHWILLQNYLRVDE